MQFADAAFVIPVLAVELLDRNLIDFKMRKVGEVISYGNLKKGEVADKKDDLQKAFDMGVKLATSHGVW